MRQYKRILQTDGGKFLYYAIPISPNSQSCMRCHGDPGDAPREMVEQYGDQAGFFEQYGDIRALISVKVPLNELLSRANKTTWTLSLITLFLLSGTLGMVFFFFHKIDSQTKIAEEKSFYLDSVLNSTKDTAILVTNESDIIIYFNKEAERLLRVLLCMVTGLPTK